ncbi:Peroxisomal membrane protein PEX29 [Bienertia sinuspersici]
MHPWYNLPATISSLPNFNLLLKLMAPLMLLLFKPSPYSVSLLHNSSSSFFFFVNLLLFKSSPLFCCQWLQAQSLGHVAMASHTCCASTKTLPLFEQ